MVNAIQARPHEGPQLPPPKKKSNKHETLCFNSYHFRYHRYAYNVITCCP